MDICLVCLCSNKMLSTDDLIRDLKTLHDKLDTLKARYDDKSKRKRIKTVLMAQSDQDHILNLLKKMENSFRHFMVGPVYLYSPNY